MLTTSRGAGGGYGTDENGASTDRKELLTDEDDDSGFYTGPSGEEDHGRVHLRGVGSTDGPPAPPRWRQLLCSWKAITLAGLITMTGIILAVVLDVDSSGSPSGNSPGPSPTPPSGTPAERACKVFCHGPLLKAVQLSGIFEDSKTFVDMPMRDEPEAILQRFHKVFPNEEAAQNSPHQLKHFVNQHFANVSGSLTPAIPPDFVSFPTIAEDQTNETLRNWTVSINRIWLTLSRKPSSLVDIFPQRFSLLNSKHPLIIPGDRFRESYYWDTYWIIMGLQRCGMTTTALYLVENLLGYVERFGFVPNGGRVYYLTRSQPPLLSEMTLLLYEKTLESANDMSSGNISLLSFAGPLLETEYDTFMDVHSVQLPSLSESETVTLNRYNANTSLPRPESYLTDYDHARNHGINPSSVEARRLYHQIASGAETGWDFSSRWLQNNSDFATIGTDKVIPVELNTILYRMELNLALINTILDQINPAMNLTKHNASYYIARANERVEAMTTYLWDENCSCWKDYILATESENTTGKMSDQISPANYVPIWGACGPIALNMSHSCLFDHANGTLVTNVVESLNTSSLLQEGGVLTTLVETGQQWDSPNSWAPLNHWLISGLKGIGTLKTEKFARDLARLWLRSNLIGFQENNSMFEKYDAYKPGETGAGGEYTPQVGFGWTNGVALDLLSLFRFDTLE
eukprot:gb/GECG01014164.1/.p1 GENE.gb/GECG01014164.1/~~gb/GECG01014164.1/.p1  ORF type:complete len:689 (+),score=57.66 gb/GECG01014164.1/:1-2067(+)